VETVTVSLGRGHRIRRLPKRFEDILPSSSTPITHLLKRAPRSKQATSDPPVVDPEPELAPAEPEPEPEPQWIETQPNSLGIYRSYPTKPTFDPEESIGLESLCDSPGLLSSDAHQSTSSPPSLSSSTGNIFAPFLNATTFRLMSWWYGGSGTKSTADLDRLVQDVILQADFNPKHLKDFRAAREIARLDKPDDTPGSPFSATSGWCEHSVKIRLPAEYQRFTKEEDAPQFEVSGVFVRSLTDVVRNAFQDPTGLSFHMTPFRQLWKSSDDGPPVRLHSELYSSDAMLNEHEKIRAQPREPRCELETVVAAIMLWSDSTHLASFGNTSLWPIYAFFGNQSKYTRAKPTSFACHHLAYIPSVRVPVTINGLKN